MSRGVASLSRGIARTQRRLCKASLGKAAPCCIEQLLASRFRCCSVPAAKLVTLFVALVAEPHLDVQAETR